MLVDDDDHRWVIDTCSLSQIHWTYRQDSKRLFAALGQLVDKDRLFFPTQVITELSAVEDPFPPHLWAKKHKKPATRHGECLDELAEVLSDSQVASVVDPDKSFGADEADPHILALALCLKKAGHQVTVVTEDRRDKGGKLSVVTACGLLRVYALPLAAFLRRFELIPL
ncbi:MAG: DUF4411 family protein [Deltaproteobacteria bacterium]|nr:DUF4411 family protein [Deltaproteobacteria bacterium]MBK8715811.1 DUF4411 family protein [Deltaproteobacteria bacterium]MBP7291817.1 DUF4411 family protein [Nannocystaceae bacterium]